MQPAMRPAMRPAPRPAMRPVMLPAMWPAMRPAPPRGWPCSLPRACRASREPMQRTSCLHRQKARHHSLLDVVPARNTAFAGLSLLTSFSYLTRHPACTNRAHRRWLTCQQAASFTPPTPPHVDSKNEVKCPPPTNISVPTRMGGA
eukprot:352949-Chlamydomonas_euryale.AAC.10